MMVRAWRFCSRSGVGYCLTPDNSFQRMLCLKGVSRGGKGTIVSVLEACLGSDNITGYSLDSLSHAVRAGRTSSASWSATIGEVNLQRDPNKYTIYQNLNMVTGSDLVEIEHKS